MWDLPGPRIEPVSFALADRFFITEPPGSPKVHLFFKKIVLPVWKKDYYLSKIGWKKSSQVCLFFLMYTSGSKDLREVSKGRRYGKC